MLVKRAGFKAALCAGAALAGVLAFGGSAQAQAQSAPRPPSTSALVDANGVDLTNGQWTTSDVNASVGDPSQGGLSRIFAGAGLRDNLSAGIDRSDPDDTGATYMTVSFGGTSSVFKLRANAPISGSIALAPVVERGDTLVWDIDHRTFTFRAADGTVASFNANLVSAALGADTALATSIRRANGETLTYWYATGGANCGSACVRTAAVASNLGYMIKYEYDPAQAERLTRVIAINLKQESCDPMAAACAAGAGWTYTTFSGVQKGDGAFSARDALGRETVYTLRNDKIVGVQRPGQAASVIGWTGERVTSITDANGLTSNYQWTESEDSLEVKVTDPAGHIRRVTSDVGSGQVRSITDGRGYVTSYEPDVITGQVGKITAPEGNSVSYTYNGGALASVTLHSKDGVLPDMQTTMSFVGCTPGLTCGKPSSIARQGLTTDIEYDPTTGEVSTVRGPADETGARHTIHYRYAAYTAQYNALPGMVQGPVYRLAETWSCTTATECPGSADEAHTFYYPNVAENLRVSQVKATSAAEQARQTTQIDYTYNRFGDVKTVSDPATGAVTRYRYDEMRQLVGRIGEDPDGENPGRANPTNLDAPATKYFYQGDGHLSYAQYGSVPSSTTTSADDDWVNRFAKAATEGYLYDSGGRVTQVFQRTFDADGRPVDQSATDYTYDAHRLRCIAVRMDRSAFVHATNNACVQQGQAEPDRIVRYEYNENDQVSSQTLGYLTTAAKTQSFGYTANGLVELVRDGAGSLTTLSYDGFDRLKRTLLPSKTSPGESSSTDYTELFYSNEPGEAGYHADRSQVVRVRLQDGTSSSATYDARNRLKTQNGVTFDYDNSDRLRQATSADGAIVRRYDVLGRLISETTGVGALAYEYDPAGRRTKMTWPDGIAIGYRYDGAGQMKEITGPDGAPLVSFAYDGMGRRTTTTRQAGPITRAGFDGLSRLTSLTLDFPNDVYDLSRTFAYNPANEMLSRSDVSASDYGIVASANLEDTVNPRNELETANGVNVAYARGNLTNDGGQAYTYGLNNELLSADGLQLGYDAVGRLSTSSGSGGTRFQYDGGEVVAEYTIDGVLRRRYVRGPSADELLATFDGSTTGQRTWAVTDERNSVVAWANSVGQGTGINRYDAYGEPAGANDGRFQFTGQMRLPEAGLYNYKARAYSAKLKRFLQPDPSGFDSGLNRYAYAADDPVNLSDPSGGDVAEIVVYAQKAISFAFSSVSDFFNHRAQSDRALSAEESGTDAAEKTKCQVQQSRAAHDLEVAKLAYQLRTEGYLVTTEVSFRDPGNGNRIVRADIVGTMNTAGRPDVIFDVKTGNGRETPNQAISYPKFGTPMTLVPVGLKALMAGYVPGIPRTLVPVQIERVKCTDKG